MGGYRATPGKTFRVRISSAATVLRRLTFRAALAAANYFERRRKEGVTKREASAVRSATWGGSGDVAGAGCRQPGLGCRSQRCEVRLAEPQPARTYSGPSELNG